MKHKTSKILLSCILLLQLVTPFGAVVNAQDNTIENEDGTFATEIFSEPVQYKNKNGQWKEIKNELKASKKEGLSGLSYLDSTFVYSAEPNVAFNAWSYTRVGNNGYGKSRTYLDFFQINTLPTGAVIDSAELSLYQTLSNSANTLIDLHEVTSFWEYYDVNWNTQPTYNKIPIDSKTFVPSGTNSFDITETVKSWYANKSTNNGFMLKARDENGTKREFGSSRHTDPNKNPKMTITYHIDGLGIEDYWSYDNGINLNNGNLVLSEEDVNLNGKGHPINVTRTYNSRSDEIGLFGKGWASNIETRFEFHDEPIKSLLMNFVDGDGTKINFTHGRVGMEEWNTVDSFEGMVFHLPFNPIHKDITMCMNDHNGYLFDGKTGRIKNATDNNGFDTTYSYNEDNTLKTITDSSGRKIHFTYENGKIKQVSGNEITTVRYSYTNDYLIKAETISSTGNVLYTVSYTYDANGNLISVTDAKNQSTEIQYSADDRVITFIEKVTENEAITTLRTTYDYDFVTYDTIVTTKTNPKGIKTRFHTNDAGNIVKIEDNYNVSTGKAESTEEYEWDQNHLLTPVSDANVFKTGELSLNPENLK